MKTLRLLLTASVLCLFCVLLTSAVQATPTLNPCMSGTTYDPACDVNHDGVIDVLDVQLTANKWSRSGTYTSDNDHNHLGQTWVGSNNPLVISGTFSSFPDAYAPLVLNNSAGTGTGVSVSSAGNVGMYVGSAGGTGVYVYEAGDDGVLVYNAGSPSSHATSTGKNGFEVAGAEGNGLYVGQADWSGVEVAKAGDDGVFVGSAGIAGVFVWSAGDDGYFVDHTGSAASYGSNAGNNGVEIGNAEDYGVYVNSAGHHGFSVTGAGSDGMNVGSAVDDGLFVCRTGNETTCNDRPDLHNGIEIGSTQDHGIRIDDAGLDGLAVILASRDGVHVETAGADGVLVHNAGGDGVWASTTDANHEWGIFTPDKIYAGTTTLSALTVIAQVTGSQALSPGDVVAAVGVADPLPDSNVSLALVQPASSGSSVIGVVEGRMALTTKPQDEDEAEREPVLELRSADGPALPGDYVALTMLGVAQVKVEASAQIQPGQRLTASDVAGKARALRTKSLDGMLVSEGAPTIGIALAVPEPGQDTIPVFVTLR